jgi:hypothetical protein
MDEDQVQGWTQNLPLPPHPPSSLLNILQTTLGFTADYRSFVDSHAALERYESFEQQHSLTTREYASKLSSLAKKFEVKVQQKAKGVSVGDEPSQEGEGWEHQQ